MGWVSNDGLHEGYLAPEFADGVRGNGTSGFGVPSDRVIVAIDYVDDPAGDGLPKAVPTSRPEDEVIGWRLLCNCETPASAFSSVASTWEGPLWARVATRALEDVEDLRLYLQDDEDAVDVMDRDDVWEIAAARWQTEHISPAEAIGAITAASGEVVEATARLDQAVAYARASGKSWADIGRAAGMSRQAAHERWA